MMTGCLFYGHIPVSGVAGAACTWIDFTWINEWNHVLPDTSVAQTSFSQGEIYS